MPVRRPDGGYCHILGILELMKMGRIAISQKELFEDIEIDYLAEDVAPLEV